ncbi:MULTISPECIES: hypothetical protein [Paenibacillus]|uniref:Uncharacterized protein n=1 Tax=Paenibacillus xylanilyticus TaxID=248903 RepID=A0A7Y6C0G5_9BACL|nr:hypothetical protein [Paenibacillus xylanilyticus]NUU77868.1 hypothetical protein [Paenibacillus xylanilyticus]
MGLFEWIFDNLYIVAVVGFALFSFLGKAAKSADPNKRRPNNGMPTFGGSGEVDRNDRSPSQTATQQSAGDTRYDDSYDDNDRYEDDQYDDRYDHPYPDPAASSRQGDDFSGKNLIGGMESSLEQQMKEMEKQQQLIQKRLNRFSSAKAPVVSDTSWDEPSIGESGQSLLRKEDIRSGVLWAEVLGPPRSKQPFGSRGKL